MSYPNFAALNLFDIKTEVEIFGPVVVRGASLNDALMRAHSVLEKKWKTIKLVVRLDASSTNNKFTQTQYVLWPILASQLLSPVDMKTPVDIRILVTPASQYASVESAVRSLSEFKEKPVTNVFSFKIGGRSTFRYPIYRRKCV